MAANRNTLFISYSRLDSDWRNRFVDHLLTVLPKENIWIDTTDIQAGEQFDKVVADAVSTARCALLLITEKYIQYGAYARDKELPLILEAMNNDGLHVLPVLIRECAWSAIKGLKDVEFVSWSEATERERATKSSKDKMVPLAEVGDGDEYEQTRVIIKVCKQVERAMGVYSGIAKQRSTAICEQIRNRLETGSVEDRIPPVYVSTDNVRGGQFSMVLFGKMGKDDIAVKILPGSFRGTYIHPFFKLAIDVAPKLHTRQFVTFHFGQADTEPYFAVMDKMKCRTLDLEMAETPGKRLPSRLVAQILADLAQAQSDAHKVNFPLGPISPDSIYVEKLSPVDKSSAESTGLQHPKISPFRIESQLARCASLDSGQHVSWSMLSWLIPEAYEGRILNPYEYDKAEQYYLGLLGIELISGRRAVDVKCFAHIGNKHQFFKDPRLYIENMVEDDKAWLDEDPSLAFVLGRWLLSPEPDGRYGSADEARDELRDIAAGRLPNSLRKAINESFLLVSDERFGMKLYESLKSHPVGVRFRGLNDQHKKFVRELGRFVDSDPMAEFGALQSIARDHHRHELSVEDVDAFRRTFVQEIVVASGSLSLGDAWNALLKRSFGFFVRRGETVIVSPAKRRAVGGGMASGSSDPLQLNQLDPVRPWEHGG